MVSTLAEQSGFRQTGRLDEVEALSEAFIAHWPDAVQSFVYGHSAEGRPMRALLVSRAGALTPQALRRNGIPLLMIQGGIHPGESDGKDAGFIALRELLGGDPLAGVSSAPARDLLERIAVLFVPAFNTDGHERVGRWNRPNQNGPEVTGWRTTAQNVNLNRDYTKAMTPEMQAMLRLIDEWDPLICADLHVTDGADFEPDISLQVEPINQGAPSLRGAGVALRDRLIDKLAAQGSLPLPFYPDFARTDDPSSGFVLTVYSPRFSTGYYPQRNRFTVLVETHSWKPYEHRVRVTRNTIIGLAELTAAHGADWLRQVHEADRAATGLAGTEVALDYTSGWREPSKAGAVTRELDDAGARKIDFRGYAYTRDPSAISGALVTVYDPKTPQIWHVPYRDQVQASLKVTVPAGGYLVPAGHAALVQPKLALHGIEFHMLTKPIASAAVQAFRADRVEFSAAPFEGCQRATLSGQWRDEQQPIGAGSLVVPIEQRLARLVLTLLEPQAPDSLAAWGLFNACFEQKEQMERYVAEQIAREMLAADPALREEFERSVARDPAFAASASARLEFFLRRHTSWDARYNLYPIYRLPRALPTS
ncbi:MAG TPA: M14 family zinc carboxypeptidase [Steroidobacteraceae bacterium]|nr:M14 family zinc carboxypeptidase [Steroidobacteraceae bacterium]